MVQEFIFIQILGGRQPVDPSIPGEAHKNKLVGKSCKENIHG